MICRYCGNEAIWTSNDIMYGKRYGKSYMCYYCEKCGASVGCHNNTKKALGILANKELKILRHEAHELFDQVFGTGNKNRRKGYANLKNQFGYEVHMGESDEEQCKKIIEYLLTK